MSTPLTDPMRLSVAPDLSKDLPSPRSAQVAAGTFQYQLYRLSSGASAGVELLVVDTGTVRAAICPTRGMSLWKANINGLPCGWNSPVQGPLHPSFVAIDEPSGIGWLDGFDELLVRCGLRSFGAPDFNDQGHLQFPLHGRVGNLPARNLQLQVDQEHSLLEVQAVVHETRFLQYNLQLQAKYVFAIGESTIEIHDRVVNAGATPATMQMLYHINVGTPILEAGATTSLASRRAVARNARAAEDLADWPTYGPPTPGYEEQVYFFEGTPDEQGWAQALLASKDATRGFAVHFRPETLPYFTQWKNTVAESDGYVTGLEPGTGFPNPRAFEEQKGRVVELAPGTSREFHLKLEGITGAERVQQLTDHIGAQQAQPMASQDYDADWCMPR